MTRGPATRRLCERHVLHVRGLELAKFPPDLCVGCARERLFHAEASASAWQREACALVTARGRVAAQLAMKEIQLQQMGTRLLNIEAELVSARAELREVRERAVLEEAA